MAEKIKHKLQIAMNSTATPLDPELENDSTAQLAYSANKIKVLKNNLKQIVAEEKDKYFIIQGNSSDIHKIEVMPDIIPVYLKIQAAGLRSPCTIEFNMDKCSSMQVLASTSHKNPTVSANEQGYEKEKLFIVDSRIERELHQKDEEQIRNLVAAGNTDPATIRRQFTEK